MPAPNIAYLFDLEAAFEDPLANYFANLNVGGFLLEQVLTPRTPFESANNNANDYVKTPRLTISVSILGLGGVGSGSQVESYTQNNVQQNYWAHYQLGIALTLSTARNNNAQPHGLLRGGIRAGMLSAAAVLNSNSVPYFQTADLFPLASQQGIDAENDELQTQMQYQAEVFLPPASFPNA